MTTTKAHVCTCGEAEPHIIARRTTADGTTVVLWSDGPVTGWMGLQLPGVTIVRPRTAEAIAAALKAGWLFMGEVCIRDTSDLAALYRACRKVAKRNGLPGDVRATMAKDARPTLSPRWDIYAADRDGKPTLRVWRLPRLRWPGLVVWDHVSQGRGGRYEIVSADRKGVCSTTGIRFETLAEVSAHLLEVA